MKVLIVDDSKVMRMIVARALRQAGVGNVELGEAEDGVKGLAVASSFEPDLILSDWNMPEMNGVDFLRNLRSAGISTRFGFVTSETHPAIKAQAIEAGADFLITKPFNADTFSDVFSGLVN